MSETSTERYYHETYKVTSQAGLDTGSQVKPEFDPTYQELIFHSITISRGDRVIDSLQPREIKLIQPETDLDEREYNGRISALVFLNDVRVGDVVDYAYSVNGANPVMSGRFAARMFLIASHPIQLLRCRILWASARPLQYRTLNTDLRPAIRELPGLKEYTWERQNVPSLDVDDQTPGWFDPYPFIELTDFASWSEVAAWAIPLYKTSSPPIPDLAKQVLLWTSASSRREDQLLAALRFVQDEIRYLAIEIGPNSNRPNPPSVVFKRRYGDCKDKSLLLVTILNELGIEAYPALVNTRAQGSVSDSQPSPFAFDHCIVKAICGAKTFWLDPTIALQRGSLDNLASADEGRALVLKAGNRELEAIPTSSNDRVLISVNEIYSLDRYTDAASLEVTTTYRDEDADSQRYSLTRNPIADLAKGFLNYYAHTDPSISADGPPTVSDDPVSNTLVVTERYRIPDFLHGSSREVFADRINEELARPSITQRAMPLAIAYPVYVEQTIEMRLPDRPVISAASGTLSDEASHFEYTVGLSGSTAHLKFTYRTLQDHVEAARVAKHLELVERIRDALSHRVSRGKPPSEEMSDGAAAVVIGILAAPFIIIGLVIGVRRGKRRRRSGPFNRTLQIADGEGPEKPFPVPAEGGIVDMLKSLRCRCGAAYRFEEPAPSQQRLIYDGRRLIAVTVTYEACGTGRDVYFAPSDLP